MKSHKTKNILLVLIFIILYSFFVFYVKSTVENYSDIIVGTTFFFTLFIGFFITRQNDRYSAINDQLTSTDGYFSYLYRVTGLVPRIQNEVREVVRDHYTKILESNNPAYHVMHPSNTLTRMTQILSSITEEENSSPAVGGAWGFLFEVISDLQLLRKKILNLYEEKLVMFQWAIVYILAILLVVSFNFVPSSSILVMILKVFFGTSVFISIILLRQLNNLTLFGDEAGMQSVHDIFNIIDEKDAKELKK
jgi:hypothetical protein